MTGCVFDLVEKVFVILAAFKLLNDICMRIWHLMRLNGEYVKYIDGMSTEGPKGRDRKPLTINRRYMCSCRGTIHTWDGTGIRDCGHWKYLFFPDCVVAEWGGGTGNSGTSDRWLAHFTFKTSDCMESDLIQLSQNPNDGNKKCRSIILVRKDRMTKIEDHRTQPNKHVALVSQEQDNER